MINKEIEVVHIKSRKRFIVKERLQDLFGETYFIIENNERRIMARPTELKLKIK